MAWPSSRRLPHSYWRRLLHCRSTRLLRYLLTRVKMRKTRRKPGEQSQLDCMPTTTPAPRPSGDLVVPVMILASARHEERLPSASISAPDLEWVSQLTRYVPGRCEIWRVPVIRSQSFSIRKLRGRGALPCSRPGFFPARAHVRILYRTAGTGLESIAPRATGDALPRPNAREHALLRSRGTAFDIHPVHLVRFTSHSGRMRTACQGTSAAPTAGRSRRVDSCLPSFQAAGADARTQGRRTMFASTTWTWVR